MADDKPERSEWKRLNALLMLHTAAEIPKLEKLIKSETAGKGRKYILNRIHQRIAQLSIPTNPYKGLV